MKRYGNLFEKIYNKQNIFLAHQKARKKKTKRKAIKDFDNNISEEINKISEMIKNKTYKVSPYKIDKRIERKKERIIYKLPYNPDRIIHHAVLQIIEPILAQTYIKDTYQSIKNRGVHKAKDRIKQFLKDKENTKYCLKIDIKKFYPNVDNQILKKLLRKKIKCNNTLELLDTIIDSTKGLPIGNYTSQCLGNYYLTYFDHFVKEQLKIKYFIRYADDMIFLLSSKKQLHTVRDKIKKYLKEKLKLNLKENYQVFPTYIRGIDFLGFRFFDNYIILRKSIKKEIIKLLNKKPTHKRLLKYNSYYGWIKATNSYNLMRKYITKDLIFQYQKICDKIKINNIFDKIKIKPKKLNKYGYYQPTLLNFI